MERLSDKAIEIINDLHTERLDYTSEYLPLIEAAQKLAAYEDTGLEPEEIAEVQSSVEPIPFGRFHDIMEAEREERLVVLPDVKYTDSDGEKALQKAIWTCGNTNNPVTRYTADAIAEKLCRDTKEENTPLTRAEAEAALKKREETDNEH